LPADRPAEPPLQPTMPFEPVQSPAQPQAEQPTAHAPTVPLSTVTDEAGQAWGELESGLPAAEPPTSPADSWSAGGEEPAYRPAADSIWPAAPTSMPERVGASRRTSRDASVLDAWDIEDSDLARQAPGVRSVASGGSETLEADGYARRTARYSQPLAGAPALDTGRRSQTACLVVGFIAAAVLACVVGMAAGVLLVSLWSSL